MQCIDKRQTTEDKTKEAVLWADFFLSLSPHCIWMKRWIPLIAWGQLLESSSRQSDRTRTIPNMQKKKRLCYAQDLSESFQLQEEWIVRCTPKLTLLHSYAKLCYLLLACTQFRLLLIIYYTHSDIKYLYSHLFVFQQRRVWSSVKLSFMVVLFVGPPS